MELKSTIKILGDNINQLEDDQSQTVLRSLYCFEGVKVLILNICKKSIQDRISRETTHMIFTMF